MAGSKLLPGKYIALTKQSKKFKFSFKEDEKIDLNGKSVDIKFEEDAAGFQYVVYGKEKYQVELVSKNQNKYQVLINNVGYDFSIETPTSFRRKKFLQKKYAGTANLQLIAPMPGKIVEVLVEEGSEVKEGDALVILEAMKMQNEISSLCSGVVKKVYCKAGDNVMKEELLVEFVK